MTVAMLKIYGYELFSMNTVLDATFMLIWSQRVP